MNIRFVCASVIFLFLAEARAVTLQNQVCSISMDPATLGLNLTPTGGKTITISTPQPQPGSVSQLKQRGNSASWMLSDKKLHVSVRLETNGLFVGFAAENPGSITWPVGAGDAAVKAWILPMFEGVYVPTDDLKWISFLTTNGPQDTTADLGLPFLGWDFGDHTVAMILTNSFNNQLQFTNEGGRLEASLTHEFTRNNPVKETGFVIQIGTNSPIAPALFYRQWLQQRGEFVSLADKIKRIPEAAKLPGAAHIYIWGEGALSMNDVIDWKRLANGLQNTNDGAKVLNLFKPETRDAVKQISTVQWPDRYMKLVVLEELNQLLANSNINVTDISDYLLPLENCGGGISPRMIDELMEAGFDRLWIGTASWDGFLRNPETVKQAKEKGYLIGPYDSYNSIHRPGDPDTWETAQFDQKLYDTGAIVRADGTKRTGFKKKGFKLSPLAVRPYVEQRVSRLMKSFAANSWFMDCDGFGEYFDDYSPLHPATQYTDLQERVSRLRWIGDKFGAVVGTEGCSAGVASAVCFSHGVMTPVIGWGDPDLTDKKSKFYLGSYYPPNEPSVFFKFAQIKEDYRYIYYNPRFRLPLFEAVFHDSVVATHHWSTGTLKFFDAIKTTVLLESLYSVPPLFHLNRSQLQGEKGWLKTYYDFFSPLHRESAFLPLSEFAWLTTDRMVQKTVFGKRLEMTANFGPTDFNQNGVTVPSQSVLAKWRDTGKTNLFSPLVR